MILSRQTFATSHKIMVTSLTGPEEAETQHRLEQDLHMTTPTKLLQVSWPVTSSNQLSIGGFT